MITREDYEQGRVRRRDGGALRLHVFADETECKYHLGEVRHSGGKWGPLTWRADGFISPIGEESSLDLILRPRKRTVWINVHTDWYTKSGLSATFHESEEAAKAIYANTMKLKAFPLEIDE